jgi:dihydroorotase
MKIITVLFLLALPVLVSVQSYNLLLKGGHLIDAKNGIDSPMDVEIKDGKIARLAVEISDNSAEQIVDVSGLYLSP